MQVVNQENFLKLLDEMKNIPDLEIIAYLGSESKKEENFYVQSTMNSVINTVDYLISVLYKNTTDVEGCKELLMEIVSDQFMARLVDDNTIKN